MPLLLGGSFFKKKRIKMMHYPTNKKGSFEVITTGGKKYLAVVVSLWCYSTASQCLSYDPAKCFCA